MTKYVEIQNDCECEKAKHEIDNYPREGLKRYKFKKNELYLFITVYNNFYGNYYRIKTESGYIADILMSNGKIVEND